MNKVQPIRDLRKLDQLKYELKKNGLRDYMMFYTGLNSRYEGIRCCKIECR